MDEAGIDFVKVTDGKIIKIVSKTTRKATGKKATLSILKNRCDEKTYNLIIEDMEKARGTPVAKRALKIVEE
jgi:hypothetical protein